MSNIVKFGSANLPTAASLAASLRGLESGALNMVILKMDRTGHWVYGVDQTEVDKEGLWAVNPFSFVHGYIAWGEGCIAGEKMVGITEPLPVMDAPPSNAPLGWQAQVGMSLKCISGEDKGLEARFSTTSHGGKKAMHQLAMKVADQVEADQEKPVAVIKLSSEHYPHKIYGRTFNPVMEVVDWISLEGEPVVEAAPEDTGRRRRG
jgi:hypothetical protein